ncbi:putative Acetylcholine receptor subunit alpha [Daphnia magna]|uniref:Putative Acetylcholine receptor subunit alpha n=1 Tax=Daphnia magna TaxID=35525 RepID=A0A164MKE0_9CRUS|nr:putative Acetylcholine receptor subunit alpha [Daphnia magna]
MAHRQESKNYCSSGLTCTTAVLLCCWYLVVQPASCGNPDAKRLYDDLLSNYNKIVRPVVNNSDVLTVRIKLKLSQLIDLASVSFSLFFLVYSVYGAFVFAEKPLVLQDRFNILAWNVLIPWGQKRSPGVVST